MVFKIGDKVIYNDYEGYILGCGKYGDYLVQFGSDFPYGHSGISVRYWNDDDGKPIQQFDGKNRYYLGGGALMLLQPKEVVYDCY